MLESHMPMSCIALTPEFSLHNSASIAPFFGGALEQGFGRFLCRTHSCLLPLKLANSLSSNSMADTNDDLLDYEEEEEALQVQAKATPKKKAAEATAKAGAKEVKKGSYVGVHSTGFRDFLLKPELLRAIVDCGFEHPSEGRARRK